MQQVIVTHAGFNAGASCVGKGYGINGPLEEYHKVIVFVSGDWCRDNAPDHAANGIIVDDDLILKATLEFFRKKLASHSGPVKLVLDAPRSVAQAIGFKSMLKEHFNYQGDLFTLHPEADIETTLQRMQDRSRRHGRADDANPDAIKKRSGNYFGTLVSGDDLLGPRNQDGILHTVIPWLKENTRYFSFNAVCLEELRDVIRVQAGTLVFGEN